jgi:hypothetical protein
MNPAARLFAVVFGQPVEWLAIAGGAVLGAFLAGAFVQLFCRWTTTKKLPRFPLLTVRVVGGAAAGLLTAMWVLSGGGGNGWPFGNSGGPGDHAGNIADNGKTQETPVDKKAEDKPKNPDATATPPTAENTMRVAVMTAQMSDDPKNAEAVADQRYYLLPDGADPKTFHTLKEVQKAIGQRLDQPPPLRHLTIIGPDKDAAWVYPLEQWAKGKGVEVGNSSWAP